MYIDLLQQKNVYCEKQVSTLYGVMNWDTVIEVVSWHLLAVASKGQEEHSSMSLKPFISSCSGGICLVILSKPYIFVCVKQKYKDQCENFIQFT